MPCSHCLSHCSFHLALIWQFVFRHEKFTQLNSQVILSSTDLENKFGGTHDLPPSGFPHHHPSSPAGKGAFGKGKRGREEGLCSLRPPHHRPLRGGGHIVGLGGEEGRGRTPPHRCQHPLGDRKNSFKWDTSPSFRCWMDLAGVGTCGAPVRGGKGQL